MRPNSENCPDGQGHKIFEFLYGDGCLKCDYWEWNSRYEEEREQNLRDTQAWIERGCKE